MVWMPVRVISLFISFTKQLHAYGKYTNILKATRLAFQFFVFGIHTQEKFIYQRKLKVKFCLKFYFRTIKLKLELHPLPRFDTSRGIRKCEGSYFDQTDFFVSYITCIYNVNTSMNSFVYFSVTQLNTWPCTPTTDNSSAMCAVRRSKRNPAN